MEAESRWFFWLFVFLVPRDLVMNSFRLGMQIFIDLDFGESVNIFRTKNNLALAAVALAVSTAASATPLTLSSIAGTYQVYDSALSLVTATQPNAEAALVGTVATPGGNVELGQFGGPVTVLTGTGSGHTVSLSSLVLTDWTDNNNALAKRYIQDAAFSAFGYQLPDPGPLDVALTNFFNVNTVLGSEPWKRVSDPNISYLDITGYSLSVGLAGLYDASAFLTAISGVTFPSTQLVQASEVVKVSIDGADAVYLYGFNATATGVSASDGQSFSGNYNLTTSVPEPASLALVALGLLGLGVRRRKSVKSA